MQIKIEIEVEPEELRHFLGLPDVVGLQEDLVTFLRDKVESAGEFDPATFVKGNFDTLRKSHAWQRLLAAAKVDAEPSSGGTTEDAAPEKPRSNRSSSGGAKLNPKSPAAPRLRKTSTRKAGQS